MIALPRKPKVTIKDVARESGYSTYTVSSVMNEKGDIGSEATERVLAAARRLGYGYYGTRDHQLAVNSVGIVLPDPECLHDGFYSRGVSTIRKLASENEFDCKLYTEADFAWKQTRSGVAPAFNPDALGCKGLIYFCPWGEYENTILNCLGKRVAIALIRRSMEPARGLFQAMDHEEKGMTALLHYLAEEKKCRRLVFVGPGDSRSVFQSRRLAAFEDFCRDDDRIVDSLKLTEVNLRIDMHALQNLVQRAVKKHERIAVCGSSDAIANRVMTLLFQLGYRVPEDVLVTGYDNDPISHSVSPAMTTMEIPIERMVKAGCDYITKIQNEVELPSGNTRRFNHKLILRETA